MMMNVFYLSSMEADAGRSLWDQGQPGKNGEFQVSWGIIKSCLKRAKKIKKEKVKNDWGFISVV